MPKVKLTYCQDEQQASHSYDRIFINKYKELFNSGTLYRYLVVERYLIRKII